VFFTPVKVDGGDVDCREKSGEVEGMVSVDRSGYLASMPPEGNHRKNKLLVIIVLLPISSFVVRYRNQS
jgi:hypothetical protein